ncbi:hypothetical protein Tco_1294977 [Tanacetum coccineum]
MSPLHQDCYEKKLISVEKIHTDLNVADLLTKPFDGPRFNYLVVSIEAVLHSIEEDGLSKLAQQLITKKMISRYDSLELDLTNPMHPWKCNSEARVEGEKLEGEEQEEENKAQTLLMHQNSAQRLPSLKSRSLTRKEVQEKLRVYSTAGEVNSCYTAGENKGTKKRESSYGSVKKLKEDKGNNLTEESKLEANAELSKSMLGSELQGEDFAKKMVDFVNQRKKFFAEERAKAKRNKPMTQSQLKTYMMNYLKNIRGHGNKVDEQEETNTGTETPLNPVPVAMKTPSVATYKIIKQGEKGVYQIVREDGTDIVYINFGAMLKSISRDDLTELYRIVMNRYGLDGPEDKLEKGFWKCLRIMFEEPLSTDSIWSEIEQQKIVSWRYYDTSRVHCLNLESMDVYLLSDRKYPLSAEFTMSNQHKDWLVQEQTALGKDFSNPFYGAKGLTSPEQTATGKGISNPLMAVMVCQKPYGIQLTNVSSTERVNTPGSDENRLKLYDLMYKIVKVADARVKD